MGMIAMGDDVYVTGATYSFGDPHGRCDVYLLKYNFSLRIDIGILKTRVGSLVDQGFLKRGLGNSLTKKLDHSAMRFDKGDLKVSANQLEAFCNEVSSLIAEGKLLEEKGRPLITSANSIIHELR